jgi:hypothetical protein
VARSGEHDEFGPAHGGLYRLADRDGGAYVVVGVQQERRYVDFGQYVALVRDARTGHGPEAAGTELPEVSTNLATRSALEGGNIDGTIAATNSSGCSPDAFCERASRRSASSAPNEPSQPAYPLTRTSDDAKPRCR